MKLLVINNLSSGFQDGMLYDYIRILSHDGDEIVLRCTDGSTSIESMLYDAESFDCVVAAGGDGTIAAVSYTLAYSGVPILPFPAGTANLLYNNLHLPVEAHALAKITREMHCLDFDLGEMRVGDRTFGFGIMAGAGYDAAIMHGAQPQKKKLGPLAYFQSAIANALTQKSHISLLIDGKPLETEGLGVLLVNFPRIQMDIPVTPDTDARDGELEIAVLKGENAFALIPAFIAATLDRDGEHPGRTDAMDIYRGNEVTVFAEPPFHVQYDGEALEYTTPLSAHVLEHAARFIVTADMAERLG